MGVFSFWRVFLKVNYLRRIFWIFEDVRRGLRMRRMKKKVYILQTFDLFKAQFTTKQFCREDDIFAVYLYLKIR